MSAGEENNPRFQCKFSLSEFIFFIATFLLENKKNSLKNISNPSKTTTTVEKEGNRHNSSNGYGII